MIAFKGGVVVRTEQGEVFAFPRFQNPVGVKGSEGIFAKALLKVCTILYFSSFHTVISFFCFNPEKCPNEGYSSILLRKENVVMVLTAKPLINT